MKVVNNYQLLANGIVRRAAEDYQKALCGIGYGKKDVKDIITECEDFFRSDWYEMLTNVDPDYLIKALKNEAKEYNYDWKSIRKAHGINEEDEEEEYED